MKYILALFLLAVVSYAQKFVGTGTGLSRVSYHLNLAGIKEGCLFMAACVIGGLRTNAEMLSTRTWAVNKGYIRNSDTYFNVGSQALAQYISANYGTRFHNGWSAKQGCGHYWVVE